MRNKHKHIWLWNGDPYRVCAHCFLVQSHDGKRWRNAPKAIQNYVRAQAMFIVIACIVRNPEVITRLGEDISKALQFMFEEPETHGEKV